MSAKDLQELLRNVDDTRELVLRSATTNQDDWLADELHAAWEGARDDAEEAYLAWCEQPSDEAFVVYRAACDREEAAAEALATR